MTNDKLFVKELINELMENTLDYYSEMLEKDFTDEYSKSKILEYVKIITFNNISTFLGILDGTSFIDNMEGDISLLVNGEEIQGGLQDIFYNEMEDFIKSLRK